MSGLLLASYVALWVLVAVMAVLLLLLYRHFGMMSLGTLEGVQRDGLPVGSVAPAISGVDAGGVDRGWEPKTGRHQLLLFAAPDCEPCAEVMPHVDRLARTREAGVGVAAVVPGPRSEAVRMAERYAPPFPTLAEDGSGAFGRFRVRVTPFGFVIGPDGRVLAKGLCGDAGRLGNLLHAAGLEGAAAVVQAQDQPMTLVGSGANGANGVEHVDTRQ
jgi:thiol-disulfide isomerase/thioredoxin